MNLFVRMLLVLLRAAGAPRTGPLEPTALGMRVWPTDLDVNLHMNNGRLLSVLDLGRVDLMARMGGLGVVLRRRWQPVVAGIVVRYRRPLGPFRRFRLTTRLIGWDDRWFFMEQRVETPDGRIAALAVVRAAMRRAGGGVVTPQETFAAIGARADAPALPDELARLFAAEQEMADHLLEPSRAEG
jgi:acyl-CoA thioesterase FadM